MIKPKLKIKKWEELSFSGILDVITRQCDTETKISLSWQ